MKYLSKSYIIILALVFLLCSPDQRALAQTTIHDQITTHNQSSDTERKVKAAMVRGLLQFVTWPPKDTSLSSPSINVCIAGQNPFGEWVLKISERTINGAPIKVNIADNLRSLDLKYCSILYISKNLSSSVTHILERVNKKPILTISEVVGFTNMGGMIEFVKRRNKIKFKINNRNALRANLKINSKLLELSE